MTKSKYVIFDIDGCCIDITNRLPYLVSGDYATFRRLWRTDKPIEAGVAVYTALMDAGFQGVFLTARKHDLEGMTREQLKPLFPGFGYHLLMAEKYHEDHSQYKIDRLKEFLADQGATLDDVLLCFDDNLDVVKRYREAGLKAYLTDEGWK
jgi:hypothetical protein